MVPCILKSISAWLCNGKQKTKTRLPIEFICAKLQQELISRMAFVVIHLWIESNNNRKKKSSKPVSLSMRSHSIVYIWTRLLLPVYVPVCVSVCIARMSLYGPFVFMFVCLTDDSNEWIVCIPIVFVCDLIAPENSDLCTENSIWIQVEYQ